MKRNLAIIFILIVIFSFQVSYADDRVSLGYIYNSSKSHTEIVNDTKGNINTVSPTCFDISADGHLEINNIFDSKFVEDMHSQNVLVTPFLSNHWGRQRAMKALGNSEILAEEVAKAVFEYNLDGINVDLENLLPSYKEKLTDFVRILREKLGNDKILSVAVAANPNRLSKTWVAAYDYAELAEYANYLVLMAYDEHSAGGSEGPVASVGFVEKSIEVILESVSRDKVVLGIPLYGRFWQEGAEMGGEAIIISQIDRIANRYKVVPEYNETTGTATIKINVQSGEKKAYVNGRYLDEGSYTVYFENENSISAKMKLMNDYGLKGAGLWALGNENDEFWDWYENGINNLEYESEASINERLYYEEIEKIAETIEPLRLDYDLKVSNKIEIFKIDLKNENRGIEYIKIAKNNFLNVMRVSSKIDNSMVALKSKNLEVINHKPIEIHARSKLSKY